MFPSRAVLRSEKAYVNIKYEFLSAVAVGFGSSKRGLVPHRGLNGFTPHLSGKAGGVCT